MLLQVFHVSVFALYSFTLWYDQKYIDLPFPAKELEDFPFKARQMFLTVWCLVLQAIYFAVSFLNDISGTNAESPKRPPLIRRAKDILFSLALPVAIYVSMVFWGIYFLHKDLIFPDEIEALFPVWVNHVMHTFIVPFILIELLVTRRNYPSRKFGVKMLVYFMCVYTLWVLAVYIYIGFWAYPFLEFLNWPQKVVFAVFSTVLGVGIYVLGEKVNDSVSPRPTVYTNGVNGKKKH